MPAGIIYIDVDDEITSAAARIRTAPGRRVALVLPYGSRVATSRINFRLLSRDAVINEKQLAVVAGDSATRALAASAGLPSFATVGEYESSLAGLEGEAAAVSTADAGTGVGPSAGGAEPGPTREPPADARPNESPATVLPAVSDDTIEFEAPASRKPPAEATWQPSRPSLGQRAAQVSTSPAGLGRAPRLPLVVVLAVVALVILVGSVGAYVVLPSATIVVTPRTEALVPVDITVTADPNATEPDAAARVVPAEVVSLEVTASDTFPVTGQRVEETEANGTVQFSNLDFLRSNSVPAGSVVSTNAGVRFATVGTVTVPRADLVGLTVFPGRISVNVTAVEPGTTGNVEPNTIVIVPKGEDPQALKVVNPDATSGGTHDEFPQVAQEDVDGAIAELTAALDRSFQARLADPTIAPAGTTVFTETASLGEPAPSVDPATLVGQEIETFALGLSASGTVVTIDPAPVTQIAEELLRATVEPGHELVAGSIDVDVGNPVVSGQSVAFSATATGDQVAVLDASELRALVLGKSFDDARAALAAFGDVELSAWPDWVGAVPTIADRVDVRIEGSVPIDTPTEPESTS